MTGRFKVEELSLKLIGLITAVGIPVSVLTKGPYRSGSQITGTFRKKTSMGLASFRYQKTFGRGGSLGRLPMGVGSPLFDGSMKRAAGLSSTWNLTRNRTLLSKI
jgi:hypothetical protein